MTPIVATILARLCCPSSLYPGPRDVHWARGKWRSRLRSAVPVTIAWLISIIGQLTWLQRSLTLNLSCLTLQMIGGTCVIKVDVIIMVWSFKERTLLFPFPAKCKDWSLSPVQLHLWIWTHYLGATWFDWLAGDYKYCKPYSSPTYELIWQAFYVPDRMIGSFWATSPGTRVE